jgi:hypothetical protein
MIINTYDQLVAAGGGVAICYRAQGDHRSCESPRWRIMRVKGGREIVTDPRAHWMDYGAKAFYTYGQDRMGVLEVAKEWAAKHLKEPGPWVRNRMRDYVPERINKQFPIPKR